MTPSCRRHPSIEAWSVVTKILNLGDETAHFGGVAHPDVDEGVAGIFDCRIAVWGTFGFGYSNLESLKERRECAILN